MWKSSAFILVLLTLFTLAACSGGQTAAGSPTPNGAILQTEGSKPSVPRQSEEKTVLSPSQTAPQPTRSPSEPPETSGTATLPVICSPLAEHPLSELPEIVSALYAPPPPGKEERHHGVDFSYYRRGERQSILGAGVQSVFGGRVAASLADTFPYGNVVIIETPAGELPLGLVDELGMAEDESVYTLYAHMGATPFVRLGEGVGACQPLGEVGVSGNAGVPHLHLEMRIGPQESRFAGMAFYSTQTSEEERDNYTLWRTSGIYRHFDPMVVFDPEGGE